MEGLARAIQVPVNSAAHLLGDTPATELRTFVIVLDRILGNLRAQ